MTTVTLVVYSLCFPVLMGILCPTPWWAAVLTAGTLSSFWSINYVAQGIESPFGDDDNSLPLVEMQTSFNQMLATLIMREAQEVPCFSYQKESHRKLCTTRLSTDTSMEVAPLFHS